MITRSLPTNYDDVIAVVDLLFRWGPFAPRHHLAASWAAGLLRIALARNAARGKPPAG